MTQASLERQSRQGSDVKHLGSVRCKCQILRKLWITDCEQSKRLHQVAVDVEEGDIPEDGWALAAGSVQLCQKLRQGLVEEALHQPRVAGHRRQLALQVEMPCAEARPRLRLQQLL